MFFLVRHKFMNQDYRISQKYACCNCLINWSFDWDHDWATTTRRPPWFNFGIETVLSGHHISGSHPRSGQFYAAWNLGCPQQCVYPLNRNDLKNIKIDKLTSKYRPWSRRSRFSNVRQCGQCHHICDYDNYMSALGYCRESMGLEMGAGCWYAGLYAVFCGFVLQ